jgi:maltokinase
VSEPEAIRGREHLSTWLRSAQLADLLPPRRRDASPVTVALAPRDVLPLGGGRALAVAQLDRVFVVVPVSDAGGAPRRAVPGDGVFAAIVRAMLRSEPGGAFRGHAFDGAIDLASDDEVAIDVDQSNDSVIVGGSVVVKLFPVTSPGPQPGLDLPVHLASVGFASLPTPLGALHWTPPDGEGIVIATATSFLPGATDGWEWYLERLLRWLGGDVDAATALEPAAALGRVAGRMHAAFATPSDVLPEPVSAADNRLAEAWRRASLAVADEALAVTDGDAGARLRERADAVREELDHLGHATGAVITRVHGDFHVGQVLEWDGGYAVTDFDGDPMASAADRGAFDTPVRDVAAFVRSIDHLGRIASRRRADRHEAVERWIASSRDGFLDAYVGELDASGMAHLFDRSLLRPLEVAQECHEYVYAARFLPRWRYVPDLAMQTLVPVPRR